MDIKIVVATHVKYEMPKDPVYLPIHVGREGKADLGYIGDDTGIHISHKNANYCELTGLYWAWKNLNADYIGLTHYRRHFVSQSRAGKFERVLTGDEIRRLLSDCDIVLPKKRFYYIETNESHYLHAHHPEAWDAMRHIMRVRYPECIPALQNMCRSYGGHRFNMLIMKRELLDAYCSWLFHILDEVERTIDIRNYCRKEARVFGYLSERLLDVWLDTHKLKYKEASVLNLDNEDWIKKIGAFIRRKYLPEFGMHRGDMRSQ